MNSDVDRFNFVELQEILLDVFQTECNFLFKIVASKLKNYSTLGDKYRI